MDRYTNAHYTACTEFDFVVYFRVDDYNIHNLSLGLYVVANAVDVAADEEWTKVCLSCFDVVCISLLAAA